MKKETLAIALAFLGLGIAVFVVLSAGGSGEEEVLDTGLKASPSPAIVPSEVLSQKTYSQPPEMFINEDKSYTAIFQTNKGEFTVEFFVKETPIAVNNFIFLAQEGFYNGTIFRRIIKDFMIQGGDPKGDGTGDPGYEFDDEPISKDYTRGTLAMANHGPNTNGSQFFIIHKDYNLPKNYVIFGQVIEGIEVVDEIAETEVTYNDFGEKSKPVEKIVLEEVVVKEK